MTNQFSKNKLFREVKALQFFESPNTVDEFQKYSGLPIATCHRVVRDLIIKDWIIGNKRWMKREKKYFPIIVYSTKIKSYRHEIIEDKIITEIVMKDY